MAYQKFTSKISVSQPRDEDIKDTNSKLVQPTHSHELDANKRGESHDDHNEEDSLVPVRKKVQIQKIQYAIPRRKVKLDNKACHFPLFTGQPILF